MKRQPASRKRYVMEASSAITVQKEFTHGNHIEAASLNAHYRVAGQREFRRDSANLAHIAPEIARREVTDNATA